MMIFSAFENSFNTATHKTDVGVFRSLIIVWSSSKENVKGERRKRKAKKSLFLETVPNGLHDELDGGNKI